MKHSISFTNTGAHTEKDFQFPLSALVFLKFYRGQQFIWIRPEFIVLYIGCVATAAADTMASEIGVTGGIPYMITTLKKVPIGTNGGVTMTGELIALAGGFLICVVALLLSIISPWMLVICTIAGFTGTNIDSLIGATLENKGYVGNAGTNLLATLGGGIFALALFLLIKI